MRIALHLNLQHATVRISLGISTGMAFGMKTYQIYASEHWEYQYLQKMVSISQIISMAKIDTPIR
jgi:hypothetical protein